MSRTRIVKNAKKSQIKEVPSDGSEDCCYIGPKYSAELNHIKWSPAIVKHPIPDIDGTTSIDLTGPDQAVFNRSHYVYKQYSSNVAIRSNTDGICFERRHEQVQIDNCKPWSFERERPLDLTQHCWNVSKKPEYPELHCRNRKNVRCVCNVWIYPAEYFYVMPSNVMMLDNSGCNRYYLPENQARNNRTCTTTNSLDEHKTSLLMDSHYNVNHMKNTTEMPNLFPKHEHTCTSEDGLDEKKAVLQKNLTDMQNMPGTSKVKLESLDACEDFPQKKKHRKRKHHRSTTNDESEAPPPLHSNVNHNKKECSKVDLLHSGTNGKGNRVKDNDDNDSRSSDSSSENERYISFEDFYETIYLPSRMKKFKTERPDDDESRNSDDSGDSVDAYENYLINVAVPLRLNLSKNNDTCTSENSLDENEPLPQKNLTDKQNMPETSKVKLESLEECENFPLMTQKRKHHGSTRNDILDESEASLPSRSNVKRMKEGSKTEENISRKKHSSSTSNNSWDEAFKQMDLVPTENNEKSKKNTSEKSKDDQPTSNNSSPTNNSWDEAFKQMDLLPSEKNGKGNKNRAEKYKVKPKDDQSTSNNTSPTNNNWEEAFKQMDLVPSEKSGKDKKNTPDKSKVKPKDDQPTSNNSSPTNSSWDEVCKKTDLLPSRKKGKGKKNTPEKSKVKPKDDQPTSNNTSATNNRWDKAFKQMDLVPSEKNGKGKKNTPEKSKVKPKDDQPTSNNSSPTNSSWEEAFKQMDLLPSRKKGKGKKKHTRTAQRNFFIK